MTLEMLFFWLVIVPTVASIAMGVVMMIIGTIAEALRSDR